MLLPSLILATLHHTPPCSAAFTFNALPFKVPYPVPFRLLGDEAKGWIDVTYLSPDGKLRLTRGNKVGPEQGLRAQLCCSAWLEQQAPWCSTGMLLKGCACTYDQLPVHWKQSVRCRARCLF